jgi:phage terminase large subunit-like protein
MTTYQMVEVTATTDSSGNFNFSFDNPIDKVMVSVNAPQVGGDTGLVSASAQVTGQKSVKVRCWVTSASPDNWSVQNAVSKQVTVTLLGGLG